MEKPFKAERYKNVTEVGDYIIQSHNDIFVIWDKTARVHLDIEFEDEGSATTHIEECLEY